MARMKPSAQVAARVVAKAAATPTPNFSPEEAAQHVKDAVEGASNRKRILKDTISYLKRQRSVEGPSLWRGVGPIQEAIHYATPRVERAASLGINVGKKISSVVSHGLEGLGKVESVSGFILPPDTFEKQDKKLRDIASAISAKKKQV